MSNNPDSTESFDLRTLSFSDAWSLILEKLDTWAMNLISHLPNFVVALLILLLFVVLARLISSGVKRVLHRTFESPQIADLFSAICRILILATGVFIALEFLGLSGTVTSLLAGAGIVGLAIGFAFQDMTENFIAGVAMGIRKPFKIGDVIASDKVFGTVSRINLRNTLVETFFGQLEIIPNKLLFRNIVTNYSKTGRRRVEIPVGISYGDDIEKAKKAIVDEVQQLDCVKNNDDVAVFAEGFGNSSMDLLVWFWIDYPGETGYMQARHDGVVAIKRAFDNADIMIPFPIRTLDFGIRGGVPMHDMLRPSDHQTDEDTE